MRLLIPLDTIPNQILLIDFPIIYLTFFPFLYIPNGFLLEILDHIEIFEKTYLFFNYIVEL